VRAFSCSLPASVAQQLLRTWANGWTTSYRMHETELLNCIFGCVGCLDTQQNYLICPALWGVINVIVDKCSFDGFLSHLSLVNCSVLSAARLVVACLAYHSFKNSHLRLVLRLSVQGDLDEIVVVLRRVVSALLLKFSSTSCIGPRGLWPKLFSQSPLVFSANVADSSVTSNVLLRVPVQLLAAPCCGAHASRFGGDLGFNVVGANSVSVNYVASLRVTSNVLVQVPVQHVLREGAR